jgi:hypothetical protein
MTTADGATIETRIRINRPGDENARCQVSRAWDRRNDFSQCMQQLTASSTSSAISPRQERTHHQGIGDADMLQSRRCGVRHPNGPYFQQDEGLTFMQTTIKPILSNAPCGGRIWHG